MTRSPSEQDLQDYAWGRLDNPAVERRIRASIGTDSAMAARVETLRAMKAALHEHYDRALDWPVPDRLAALTSHRPGWKPAQTGGRMLTGAAVGVGLFAMGVVSGFWLDPEQATWRSPLVDAFERRGLLSSGAFTPLVPLESLSAEETGPALGSVITRLQRLNEMQGRTGITVEGAQTITLGHIQGVRVLLHGANGDRASLFVQPRWTQTDGRVDIVSRDEVSLATWVDGPFSFGLAAAANQTGIGNLAGTLRSVLSPARSQTAQHYPDPAQEQVSAPAGMEAGPSVGAGTIVQ